MDKSRLLFRGGIRTFKKVYPDETEATFYYKARTPNELAEYLGAEAVLQENAADGVKRQKLRAKFISSAMCDESGEPVLTQAEAELIPGTLKREIVDLIALGSNEIGDAGKD